MRMQPEDWTRAPDFTNYAGSFAYFEQQPPEVCVTIAARTALRLLPSIGEITDQRLLLSSIALPVLRAAMVAWTVATYPKRRERLSAEAASAATEAEKVDGITNSPVDAAAVTGAAAKAARDTRNTPSNAAEAMTYASGDFTVRRAAVVDAAYITKTSGRITGSTRRARAGVAVELAGARLWLSDMPKHMIDAWANLKEVVLSDEGDWKVWIDWYENRLAGQPAWSELFDLALASLPDHLWEQGPVVVNARIRELLTEYGVPEPIPLQGAGPHFGMSGEYRIALAPPSELDRAGNNLTRLRQQLPLVREAADDLAARLNTNEFPELARNLAAYRASIEGKPETIAWGVVFSRGVRLDNAASAARRRIHDRLQPPLEDAAQEALDSLLSLHGPMILSSGEGRALIADADRMDLTREQQNALRRDALAVAIALKEDNEIIENSAAEAVVEAVETIGQEPHPERGAAIGSAAIRNVTILTVGIGAVAALAGVGLLQAAAAIVTIEGLKKSKRFSALTDVLGARIDGVLRTGSAFQDFVTRNEQPLRQMAVNSAGMRWMLPYIDEIVRRNASVSPPN